MNLFKLKKDGKTVGYFKFGVQASYDFTAQGVITNPIWWRRVKEDAWFCIGKYIDFDEAMPYVCNDKNGDKVFAGDWVDLDDFPDTGKFKVEYEPNKCAYWLNNESLYEAIYIHSIKYDSIELLKEKP